MNGYIIESARGLWWRMNAMVLADTLGRRSSEGIYPVLRNGEIVGWYVRDYGMLKAGEAW